MENVNFRTTGILQIDGTSIVVQPIRVDCSLNETTVTARVIPGVFSKTNSIAKEKGRPTIERVIFNDPATIVFWSDKSKTVVKCQPGDTFDKELGLAMCIAKKYFGNSGNFNDVFKKWIPEIIATTESDVDSFHVGDLVRVIAPGEIYRLYDEWVYKNVTNPDAIAKRCRARADAGDIGVIKYIAPHGDKVFSDRTIAYIEIENRYYMYDTCGIEKV